MILETAPGSACATQAQSSISVSRSVRTRARCRHAMQSYELMPGGPHQRERDRPVGAVRRRYAGGSHGSSLASKASTSAIPGRATSGRADLQVSAARCLDSRQRSRVRGLSRQRARQFNLVDMFDHLSVSSVRCIFDDNCRGWREMRGRVLGSRSGSKGDGWGIVSILDQRVASARSFWFRETSEQTALTSPGSAQGSSRRSWISARDPSDSISSAPRGCDLKSPASASMFDPARSTVLHTDHAVFRVRRLVQRRTILCLKPPEREPRSRTEPPIVGRCWKSEARRAVAASFAPASRRSRSSPPHDELRRGCRRVTGSVGGDQRPCTRRPCMEMDAPAASPSAEHRNASAVAQVLQSREHLLLQRGSGALWPRASPLVDTPARGALRTGVTRRASRPITSDAW